MVDILERPTNDFREAATSQTKVTLEIDSDLAEYLKSEFPEGWQAHANDLLRFFMETSQQKEREFADVFAQPEQDETAAPPLTPI